VALHRLLDRGEVLAREALEYGHLLGPARGAVLDSVGERGGHEAAVSPRGAEGDPLTLEQDHLTPRVILAREKGGPEAGETSSDDEQVRRVVSV
jgi:hypothetical protein